MENKTKWEYKWEFTKSLQYRYICAISSSIWCLNKKNQHILWRIKLFNIKLFLHKRFSHFHQYSESFVCPSLCFCKRPKETSLIYHGNLIIENKKRLMMLLQMVTKDFKKNNKIKWILVGQLDTYALNANKCEMFFK